MSIIAEVMVSNILTNHTPALTGSPVCAESHSRAERHRGRQGQTDREKEHSENENRK